MATQKTDKPKKSYILNKEQHALLLTWLAEGLTPREMNDLAVENNFPIALSNQLLYQYRRTHSIDLSQLMAEMDDAAIRTGLALRAKRIEALIKLAGELEADIFEKQLRWTKDVKGIGSGDGYERVEFEEFNEAEIRQLRGIYDDIAKEMGGGITRADITSAGKAIKGYVGISPDDWDDMNNPN